MISQLGQTLVHTADSVIVGQFAGTVALAAVALGTSVFMTVLVAGIGIAYGLTPLIAQANGRGDRAECGRLLGSSLLLNIGSGIVLSVLILFGFEAVLEQLGQDPAVVDQARPFLQLLAVSLIPLMVFNTFKQFAEGLGFTRQAMNITLWGNALNIIVGIVLVKGMFGIEPMGVRGAGLATLIDRVLMSLAMGFYIFRSERFRAYRGAFRLLSFDRARSLQLLKIGGPVALQFVFEVSAFSVAAIMAGTIGATAQAAHQVAINLASMTYMMASGVASAAAIKSGNHFGARNFTALRLSALSSYHIVIGFMSLTALLFILGNNLLPYMYTSDTAVITIAAQLLIFAGLFQLFDGGQVVGLGILRGMSDVQVPTAITFIAYWVVGLPMAYLLGLTFGWGVSGIWTGLTFGLLVSAVLLYLRVRGKIRGL
ncbi:MAG TPA: MATE family efflux transporter [Chitinophagaceae bacterium]|nr:MATE family efflux transporter [Chitinophagaceae bacterium]